MYTPFVGTKFTALGRKTRQTFTWFILSRHAATVLRHYMKTTYGMHFSCTNNDNGSLLK